jgi:hypothetical protein
VLFTDKGIRIIDFEYSIMSDPLTDISCFGGYCGLSIEKILELYEKQKPKQVFIAYDKTATPHADEIAKGAQVLHLSRGGNELFGKAWNRKKKDSNDAEQQGEK